MKISQRITAIECYHNRVMPVMATSQNKRVLEAIHPEKDYSLTELVQLVQGIDKSSMSRVVNGLRAARILECAPDRKCSITNILITPSKLIRKQLEILA